MATVLVDGSKECVVILERLSPDFIRAWTSRAHVSLKRSYFSESDYENNFKSWATNKKGKFKKRKKSKHQKHRYEVKQDVQNPTKLILKRNGPGVVHIKQEAPSMPYIDIDVPYRAVPPPTQPMLINTFKVSPQNHYEYGVRKQATEKIKVKQEKISPTVGGTQNNCDSIRPAPKLLLRQLSIRLEQLKGNEFYSSKFSSTSPLATAASSNLATPTTSAKTTPLNISRSTGKSAQCINRSLASSAHSFVDKQRRDHLKEKFRINSPDLSTASSENEMPCKPTTATVTSNADIVYKPKRLSSSSNDSDDDYQSVLAEYVQQDSHASSAINGKYTYQKKVAPKPTSIFPSYKSPETSKQSACGTRPQGQSKKAAAQRKRILSSSDNESESEDPAMSPVNSLRKMSKKLQNVDTNKVKQMTRIPKKSKFDRDDDCLEIDLNSDDDFMKELNEIPDDIPPVDKSSKINRIVHKQPAVSVSHKKPDRQAISFTRTVPSNSQEIVKVQKNGIRERIQIGGSLLKPGENPRPEQRISVRHRLGTMPHGGLAVSAASGIKTQAQLINVSVNTSAKHIHPLNTPLGTSAKSEQKRVNPFSLKNDQRQQINDSQRSKAMHRELVEYDFDTDNSAFDGMFNSARSASSGGKTTDNIANNLLVNQNMFNDKSKAQTMQQSKGANKNLIGQRFEDTSNVNGFYPNTNDPFSNRKTLNGFADGLITSPVHNFMQTFNNVQGGGQNVFKTPTIPRKFSTDCRQNYQQNALNIDHANLKSPTVNLSTLDNYQSNNQKTMDANRYGHTIKEETAPKIHHIEPNLNVRDPRREKVRSDLWDIDDEQIGLTEVEMNLFPSPSPPTSFSGLDDNSAEILVPPFSAGASDIAIGNGAALNATPLNIGVSQPPEPSTSAAVFNFTPLKYGVGQSPEPSTSAAVFSVNPLHNDINELSEPLISSPSPDDDLCRSPSPIAIIPPSPFRYNEISKIDPFGPREHHTAALLSEVCFKYLNDRCDSNACVLHHYLPAVEEVNNELQKLEQTHLIQFYNVYLLRNRRLFTKYFSVFCATFGKRQLKEDLTQMVEDCVKREYYQYFAYISKSFLVTGMDYSDIVQCFISKTNHTPNCNKSIMKIILDHQNIRYVENFIREIELIAIQLNYEFDGEIKKKLENICDTIQNDTLCDILQKATLA